MGAEARNSARPLVSSPSPFSSSSSSSSFGGEDVFATLFGSDNLVFVNVFDLRDPALEGVAGVESFFFQHEFFVTGNFADGAQIVGDGMVVHLFVFQNLVLQRAALGRDGRSGLLFGMRLLGRLNFHIRQFEVAGRRVDFVLVCVVGQVFVAVFVIARVLRTC